jgi:molecular chaperone HtpG
MSADELPLVVTVPEFMRRLQAMAQLQPQAGNKPLISLQAAINLNHPLAKKIVSLSEEDKQLEMATRAYQLGLLAQNMLNGADLTQFIKHTALKLSYE